MQKQDIKYPQLAMETEDERDKVAKAGVRGGRELTKMAVLTREGEHGYRRFYRFRQWNLNV